jgi:hypothetical protein
MLPLAPLSQQMQTLRQASHIENSQRSISLEAAVRNEAKDSPKKKDPQHKPEREGEGDNVDGGSSRPKRKRLKRATVAKPVDVSRRGQLRLSRAN